MTDRKVYGVAVCRDGVDQGPLGGVKRRQGWQKERRGCQLWLDAVTQRILDGKPLPHFSQPRALSWAVLCSNRCRSHPCILGLIGSCIVAEILRDLWCIRASD